MTKQQQVFRYCTVQYSTVHRAFEWNESNPSYFLRQAIQVVFFSLTYRYWLYSRLILNNCVCYSWLIFRAVFQADIGCSACVLCVFYSSFTVSVRTGVYVVQFASVVGFLLYPYIISSIFIPFDMHGGRSLHKEKNTVIEKGKMN